MLPRAERFEALPLMNLKKREFEMTKLLTVITLIRFSVAAEASVNSSKSREYEVIFKTFLS